MKCIKIFLLFVLAFMVTTSVAFAKTVHKGDTSPVPMELCEYYEDNYDSKDFETLIIDDTCYLTVLTDEEMSIPYGENEVILMLPMILLIVLLLIQYNNLKILHSIVINILI